MQSPTGGKKDTYSLIFFFYTTPDFLIVLCGLFGSNLPGFKKKDLVCLVKAMVAYDDVGSLVPIKRTLQVIDYQNQANKESEVRPDIFLCPLFSVTV